MNVDDYKHCKESLKMFLDRHVGHNFEESIAEYSATSGVPLIICYKYAIMIGEDKNICENALKRLEEW